MALTQRLQIRQSQALVMTPQLMQAIKLLQLSNLELTAYVEGELEKNPLLERADDGEPGAGDSEVAPMESEPFGTGDHQTGDIAQDPIGDALETSRSELEQRLDADLDNVFPEDAVRPGVHAGAEQPAAYSEWASVGPGGRDDADYNPESFVAAMPTLADHLSEQLMLAVSNPVARLIGQYLINMVDDTGYLVGDLESVAEKLGAPLQDVEAVLATLQEFDPPGVCARNLAECLAIQLKERDRFDPAMQALVGKLDLLAKHDLASLRRVCGVSEEDLTDMIAEIRALNPKPGLAFGFTPVQPVVPDVYVRPGPDGGFIVELNSDTLPKVLVNQRYQAELGRLAANESTKNYLTENLQSATWLIRALDQRAKTILKVATEIVKQQDAFFIHGVQHLRPLSLKIIADAIGMHESTVSRVTANKYIATNRGVLELKYFFTSSIASADGGEAHSAEAVRHRIKELIDAENAKDVLSDDTIVERLRQVGIDIARRTVAKYREAMNIPSSIQRRRAKLAAMS
jgi:RNA polymerase sigma-54 factor